MPKRVAVVGSGTGGTFAANLLASKLKDRVHTGEVQLTLVGEGFMHYFQPANLDVAFKGKTPDNFSRTETDLINKEITFIPDPASKIDLENRKVMTADGYNIDYDQLILATGAVAAPDMIPGLREGSVNFHTGPYNAWKVWSAVKDLKKGRVGVVIAGVPHKCPPSPDEALFLLDEYFRKKGVRGDIELCLLTPYPKAYPADRIAKVVTRLFEEKKIRMIPFFNLDSVDPQAKKAFSLEGDEYEYDVLIAIPPHRGAKVISDSGIGDEEGWIPADRRTMRAKDRDDAFAIGDATNIPISKSGVVAHLEAKVVASTIAADLEGGSIEYEYNGRINCPMEVGDRRAIFVSATYENPPADQSPSLVKYAMKRGFGEIYWSALTGRWEWVTDIYFGPTGGERRKIRVPVKTDYQHR